MSAYDYGDPDTWESLRRLVDDDDLTEYELAVLAVEYRHGYHAPVDKVFPKLWPYLPGMTNRLDIGWGTTTS